MRLDGRLHESVFEHSVALKGDVGAGWHSAASLLDKDLVPYMLSLSRSLCAKLVLRSYIEAPSSLV